MQEIKTEKMINTIVQGIRTAGFENLKKPLSSQLLIPIYPHDDFPHRKKMMGKVEFEMNYMSKKNDELKGSIVYARFLMFPAGTSAMKIHLGNAECFGAYHHSKMTDKMMVVLEINVREGNEKKPFSQPDKFVFTEINLS